MSGQTAQLEQHAEPTAVESVNTAVAKFDRVAAGLADLQSKYQGVLFEVATPKGMKDALAARAAIRAPRVEVEKVRKEVKAPLLALGKEIDARAASITVELLALEEPVDQQIKAEESRREAEKLRKADAERKRVALIQDAIEQDFRCVPTQMVGQSATTIESHIRSVVAIEITADRFAEFMPGAEAARDAALVKLREMHAKQLAQEADAERLRLEREEFARQQAAHDEANRLQRERLAEREAERQRLIDEQMNKLRAERAENERIAREQQAQREREDAARREAQRAEDERRAAEHRRQQQELEAEQALQRARWGEIDAMGHQVMIAVAGRAGVRAGGTRECLAETLTETASWPVSEDRFGPLYHVAVSARQTAIDAINRELQAWDARAEAQRVAAEQSTPPHIKLDGPAPIEIPPGEWQADPVHVDGAPTADATVEFSPTANDIVQIVSSAYGVDFGQALVWCMNAFDPELITNGEIKTARDGI
jgi:hypothetical protein